VREHVPVLIQKEATAFGRRNWRLSRNDVEVDQHRDAPWRIRRDREKRGVSLQWHQDIHLGVAQLRNRDGQNGSKCEAGRSPRRPRPTRKGEGRAGGFLQERA
jgi:hypothetical protein